MNEDGPHPAPPVDDVCALCLDNFTLPCRTSCSHRFCGECILSVWRHGNATRPCRCPLCTSPITTLTPYHPAFAYDDQAAAARTIVEGVTLYNYRFRNDPHNAAAFFQRILAMLWNAAFTYPDFTFTLVVVVVGLKLMNLLASYGNEVLLISCAIAFANILLFLALRRSF